MAQCLEQLACTTAQSMKCDDSDLFLVGPLNKYKICARRDDPVIYDWLSREKVWGLQLEYELVLAHIEPKVVLEVGGNIGINAIHAAFLGHNVTVFEPQRDLAQQIELNANLNGLSARVTVNEIALSNTKGKVGFAINHNNRGGSHIEAGGGGVQVERTTLDSYLTLHPLGKVYMMKVDVEGHELNMLKGAHEFLSSKNRPEIMFFEVSKATGSTAELLHALSAFGYKLYIVDWWLPRGQERHVTPWPRVDASCFDLFMDRIAAYADVAAVTDEFAASNTWLTSEKFDGDSGFANSDRYLDYRKCL